MARKRILYTLLILSLPLASYAQWSIKNNLLYDAALTWNIGAEHRIAHHWTTAMNVGYSPYKLGTNSTKRWRHVMLMPELRYWFCDKFNGHFLGLHGMGGAYNTTGIDLPFSPFDDLADFRYKGHFYGGGISYGYQHILSRHWSLEATLGIGYAYVRYKKYPCEDCKPMADKGTENYFGPTRAALNLIYVF